MFIDINTCSFSMGSGASFAGRFRRREELWAGSMAGGDSNRKPDEAPSLVETEGLLPATDVSSKRCLVLPQHVRSTSPTYLNLNPNGHAMIRGFIGKRAYRSYGFWIGPSTSQASTLRTYRVFLTSWATSQIY